MSCTLSAAKHWIANDPNPATRNYISLLLDSNKIDELESLMMPRIAFGTAGLRSTMAPGYANINDLTVIQTSFGLIDTLSDGKSFVSNAPSVVIGFDHRSEPVWNISSRKLANLAAATFIKSGIKVHLFNVMVVTPMVPFAVRSLNASLGIMFTASHNPREYNGMKIYGSNGCLIISPTDQHVSNNILKNLDITNDKLPCADLCANPFTSDLCSDPSELIFSKYEASVTSMACKIRHAITTHASLPHDLNISPKITYTAMHGVATPFILRAFSAANLQAPLVVNSQMMPDPTFPTVSFPNPEEGEKVLVRAVECAERDGSKFILASDPDGDRLAVAEKVCVNGVEFWHFFTGNEIGVLLCDLMHTATRSAPGFDASALVALNTVVSSRMLMAWADLITRTSGVKTIVEQTLTGFKNLGNRVDTINNGDQKHHAFFAYEEAIGFMCDPFNTCDKDGITAAVAMGFLYNWMVATNSSPFNRLRRIALDAGYFRQNNNYVSTVGCKSGISKLVFDRLNVFETDASGNGKLPSSLGRRPLVSAERKASDMFCFVFGAVMPESGEFPYSSSMQLGECSMTIRSSGTEPKIKWYAELQINWTGNAINEADQFKAMDKLADAVLNEIVDGVKATWLRLDNF